MFLANRKQGQHSSTFVKAGGVFFYFVLFFSIYGCTGKTYVTSKYKTSRLSLNRLGYTIQIGAFSNVENAVRVTDSLEKNGVNAYYFVHRSGLFKVRFGNFPSKNDALHIAKKLKKSNIISEYYIVSPDLFPAAKREHYGEKYLRNSIVTTARSFLGIPYKWGGTSKKDGLDCSGLTMAVYQLNGLDLPRTSRDQFKAGIPVHQKHLKKGDLIFFATSGGKRVSHVGIYIGNNSFVHAPSKGKKIRTASLNSKYFKKRYVGSRSYL